ncbi:MAG: hypothetical protein V4519_00160 [Patescibacteria group bacterium]
MQHPHHSHHTHPHTHHRPAILTATLGYFVVLWILMLWTTLYLGFTGKQPLELLFMNIRWLNIKVLSLIGAIVLAGSVLSVVGISKMQKWGVYTLILTILIAMFANLYVAPSHVFSTLPAFLKMLMDLVALYVFTPVILLIVSLKYFSWMK